MKNGIRTFCPDDDPNDGLDDLRKSGRWLETTAFLGNGSQAVTVAVFYGVAGASAVSSREHQQNERLLAAVLARPLMTLPTYFLLMQMSRLPAHP